MSSSAFQPLKRRCDSMSGIELRPRPFFKSARTRGPLCTLNVCDADLLNWEMLFTATAAPVDVYKMCTWYRLEEHTSDLQSLMRISYAVFCLNNTSPTLSHTP